MVIDSHATTTEPAMKYARLHTQRTGLAPSVAITADGDDEFATIDISEASLYVNIDKAGIRTSLDIRTDITLFLQVDQLRALRDSITSMLDIHAPCAHPAEAVGYSSIAGANYCTACDNMI
jgi:hypothetical protein